jgi:hypothetical protein
VATLFLVIAVHLKRRVVCIKIYVTFQKFHGQVRFAEPVALNASTRPKAAILEYFMVG